MGSEIFGEMTKEDFEDIFLYVLRLTPYLAPFPIYSVKFF